jgi:hypothetical protein
MTPDAMDPAGSQQQQQCAAASRQPASPPAMRGPPSAQRPASRRPAGHGHRSTAHNSMATTADDGAVTTGSAGQGAPVDQYQHIADTYQAAVTGEPLWTHTTDATIKSLIGNDRSALEGKAVIDLACGEGVFARWAITQGAASVVGVDLSEPLIELARRAADSMPELRQAAEPTPPPPQQRGGGSHSPGQSSSRRGQRMEFQVGDLRQGQLPPEFTAAFDVAFAIHCFCHAQNLAELRGMVLGVVRHFTICC